MEKKTKGSEPALRKRMVLVSEADLQSIREAFAAGRPGTVTVHQSPARELTPQQKERRKAYRTRPEVKEKQRTYRVAGAKRLREALRAVAATVSQPSAEQS